MGLTAAGSSSQDLSRVGTASDYLGAQSHTKNHKESVRAHYKDPYDAYDAHVADLDSCRTLNDKHRDSDQ